MTAPYDTNKITRFEPREHGRNYGGEKELIDRISFVVNTPKIRGNYNAHERAIDARFYTGRSRQASTVYCSIWAHSRDGAVYLAGHGNAGGYGYDKCSAALERALMNAGVGFETGFHGAGESAMRTALTALAKRLGWRKGTFL